MKTHIIILKKHEGKIKLQNDHFLNNLKIIERSLKIILPQLKKVLESIKKNVEGKKIYYKFNVMKLQNEKININNLKKHKKIFKTKLKTRTVLDVLRQEVENLKISSI